jgi:magnesium-transporting ATPase (P-type)
VSGGPGAAAASPPPGARPELVIDGRTLSRVLGTPAEALLAELAMRCAAVIVCRASPSQKAGIVVMMRRRRLREQLAAAGVALPADGSLPAMDWRARAGRWVRHPLRTLSTRAATDTQRLLAIGDGANDVAMIQAADIGVGLLGKEGRQAANNADFAFGRFRCLTRLLLMHGGNASYRLARLIKYSFWKNITFASMFFCFQFFNGFSGQALLDGVTSAFYNAFFTAFPAGVLAVTDRPVRHLATLTAHPRAYNARPSLTAKAFWRTAVLAGAVQGAVIFFIPYLSMRTSGAGPALDDVWTLGKTLFIAVIGVVTLEAALVCRYWTWPFALVLWGSYLATWPWLPLLPLFYRAVGRIDIAQYGVGENLLRSPLYWAELGLVYCVTFSARLAEHGSAWILKPRDDMVLAEMEKVADAEAAAEEKGGAGSGRAGPRRAGSKGGSGSGSGSRDNGVAAASAATSA